LTKFSASLEKYNYQTLYLPTSHALQQMHDR